VRPQPQQTRRGVSERLNRHAPGHGRLRLALILCFGSPAFVVLASYVWLALDHGTLLLWNVVVHESGRYTLGQTVLYFSHFLREIPVAVGYALFLLGISGGAARRAAAVDGHARLTGGIALFMAGGLVATALFVSAASHGWTSAAQDLFQYRTRDDLAGYGTHWRYHWLSTLWFGAAAGLAPSLSRWLVGTRVLHPVRFWARLAWAYFLVLTLVFGVTADIFLDARYAGHQAREILTHGTLTLLLGIGVLLATGEDSAPADSASSRRPDRQSLPWIFAAVILLLPAYLGFLSLSGGVLDQGQSEFGVGAMVAAHYFEHTLDFILVLLLVGGGLAFTGSQARYPTLRK
jgi:hypothetical protein